MERDTYLPPISKCSGKKSAFIIWLDEKGRTKFRREQGYPYSPRCETDRVIIDRYYKALTPAELQHYKDVENSDYNSAENRLKRRTAQEKRRRAMAHKNHFEELEARTAHKERLQLEQRATFANPAVPVRAYVPPIVSTAKANTMFQNDLNLVCERRMEEISHQMKEKSAERNIEEIYTFVGVSVSFVYRDTQFSVMYPIPIELSIVNFSLKTGVIGSTSIHINVDPSLIIESSWTTREDMETFRKKAKDSLAYYAMETSEEPSRDLEELQKIWIQFKEAWANNGSEKAILVCEKEIYNQVTATLRIAANACGPEEFQNYLKQVEHMILPIDHLALAMKKACEKKCDDQRVLSYFIDTVVIPVDERHFCEEFHRRLPPNNCKKLICQEARGAMAVHKFCKAAFYENFFGFMSSYNEDIHAFCKNATDAQKKLIPKLNPDKFLMFNPRATNHRGALQTWTLPEVEEDLPADRDGIRDISRQFGMGPAADQQKDEESEKDSDDGVPVIRGNFRDFIAPDSDEDRRNRRHGHGHSSSTSEDVFNPPRNQACQSPASRGFQGESFRHNKLPERKWDGPGTLFSSRGFAQRGRSQPAQSSKSQPTAVLHNGPEIYDSDKEEYQRDLNERRDRHDRRHGAVSPQTSLRTFPERRPFEFVPPKHDRIARVLDEILDSEEEADNEVGDLCHRPSATTYKLPLKNPNLSENRRQSRAGSGKPTNYYRPPRCRWRIISDAEMRKATLWYSPEGVDFNPFSKD